MYSGTRLLAAVTFARNRDRLRISLVTLLNVCVRAFCRALSWLHRLFIQLQVHNYIEDCCFISDFKSRRYKEIQFN